MEDWKEETRLRLAQSYIYNKLKERCNAESGDPEALTLADEAVSYAYQRTKLVLRHMGEFTLHDGEHLFHVLKLMEKILTKVNIDNLSTPELLLLVLTAFFHDIGMAPSECDVIAWKKFWDKDPVFSGPDEIREFDKFKRYCSARPEKLDEIEKQITIGKTSIAELLKSYIISDYIRITHAERANEIIEKDWNGKIKYRDADLTVELAELCQSHSNDAMKLLDLDKHYICGPEIFACLPLIGVVLRLADILDFDMKRTPSVLFSHLSVSRPVSLLEWNKHRAIEAWEINENNITFQAKCTHPAIEASIHGFCDQIDKELAVCSNLINIINEFEKNSDRKLFVKIPFKVNRDKIETKKDIHGKPIYNYRETRFNLSKQQIIDLLLGTKLYGNPEVALRELLQNSIDACLLRKAIEDSWSNHYTPNIKITYTDETDEILIVEDNGIGMDQYIIDNYYSKIGSSFYRSADFYDLRSQVKSDYIPISRYGIGILSCFMISDTVIVDTRRLLGPHKSSDPIEITIEGQDSIFWLKDGNRTSPGTCTKLHLRKDSNPWKKMDDEQLIKYIEKVLPNPPFQINIMARASEVTRDQTSFKKVGATSLMNHSWEKHENIRIVEIEIDRLDIGIVGSVMVGILEQQGKPVKSIEMKEKSVEIEGEIYRLKKSLELSNNSIEYQSYSITINDEGSISDEISWVTLAESENRLSVHGFEVPTSLFPNSWAAKQTQVKLLWPLPMLLVIDVCGNRDLDLNAARNQVILTDNWVKFEEDLAQLICHGIRGKVTKEYWKKLKKILQRSKSDNFLNGLSRVS